MTHMNRPARLEAAPATAAKRGPGGAGRDQLDQLCPGAKQQAPVGLLAALTGWLG
jgi:hypothetical protein